MREATGSPLWGAGAVSGAALGATNPVRPREGHLRPFSGHARSGASVEIPRCAECHRPLLRPSADGLGPICRARRAAEAGLRISPLTITRTPTALMDGQISLFEELEEEQ